MVSSTGLSYYSGCKKKSSPSVKKKYQWLLDCQAWGDRRQFFVNRPCGQPFLPIGRANRLYQGVGIETGHNQQTGGGPIRLGEDRYRSVLPHTPSWPFLTDEKQNEASALLLTTSGRLDAQHPEAKGQEIPTTGWSRRKENITANSEEDAAAFPLTPHAQLKIRGTRCGKRESPRYRSFPNPQPPAHRPEIATVPIGGKQMGNIRCLSP